MVTEARVAVARPEDDASIFAGTLRTLTVGMVILITLIAFEAMAVGPALPTAARELHGLSAYGWAFTAFLLTNIVGMVVSGQLCDARGPRLPLAGGILLFAAGLAVAGTSTTMAQLIAARGVQGLGSGLLLTAIYVVIGQTYPSALQPKVFTAISAAWLVPSLVGPVVSGGLTQHVSWRWVFLGLVPFVLIGSGLLVPALRTLRTTGSGAQPDRRRVVWAVLLAAGVAVLAEAGQHPSVPTLVPAVPAVAAVAWSLHGLLPAGTFRVRPGVASAVALRALLASALFGAETIVPLMLTQQHGLGATAAGLPLTASGLSWALGSWWQARDVPGEEERRRVRLMRAGFTALAIGLALLVVATFPAAPWWLAYPAWSFAGLGAGLSITTAGVLLLKWTNDTDRGRDSAALQLADTTASSLTTGITGVFVAAAVGATIGYTTAFVSIEAIMLAITVVGIAVSGRARTVRA